MAKRKQLEEETAVETKSNTNALNAFRKASSKIQESYAKAFRDPYDPTLNQKILFDSPRLTYLFSGFTLGRITQTYGPSSAGKSTLVTYMAGQLQKKVPELHPGKQIVLYIDFERTFDPNFATRLGLLVDDEYFKLLHSNSAEEAFIIVEDLIKTEAVCAVILDSDAAMPTKAMTENSPGTANFGGGARFFSEELRRLNVLLSNYHCSFFNISQERANMAYGAKLPSVTGGNAIQYFSTVRNRVTRLETLTKLGEPAGIKIRVRNYKNKNPGCTPWRDAEMDLYFDGGFDSTSEYVDLIKEFNLVTVGGGGNFSSDEFNFKCRGFETFKEYLLSHEEVFNILKSRVDEKMLEHNELDTDTPPEDYNPEADEKLLVDDFSTQEIVDEETTLEGSE
jgi:recombination protein RecA